MKAKWGPKLGKGDSLDMKISVEAERLTVEFGLNGSYLGVAFDIVGWSRLSSLSAGPRWGRRRSVETGRARTGVTS